MTQMSLFNRSQKNQQSRISSRNIELFIRIQTKSKQKKKKKISFAQTKEILHNQTASSSLFDSRSQQFRFHFFKGTSSCITFIYLPTNRRFNPFNCGCHSIGNRDHHLEHPAARGQHEHVKRNLRTSDRLKLTYHQSYSVFDPQQQ